MEDEKMGNIVNNPADDLSSELCSKIMTCTLREAFDQLLILKFINNQPENKIPEGTYKYKTIKERYSEDVPNEVMADKAKTDTEGFRRNCKLIESLLEILLEELSNTSSYDKFSEILNAQKLMMTDEQNFINAVVSKERKIGELQRQFHEDNLFYFTEIGKYMAGIGKIKDEIEDFKVEGDIKLDYIRAWEKSKIEIIEMLNEKKEQELQGKIKFTNIHISKEKRVHQEILNAYGEIQKDFDGDLCAWKTRYTRNLDEITAKIGLLKQKLNNKIDRITELKKLHSKRQNDIDNYKEYKVKQQKIMLENKRINQAATIIQAWWKGTMVRKGFGRYKKRKDKKGKKKSSEKKMAK